MRKMRQWQNLMFVLIVNAVSFTSRTTAVEFLTFRRDGLPRQVTGKTLVEAADGGRLLLARDGFLWTVQPDELINRREDDAPFRPLVRDELIEALRAELPAGFAFHGTAHFVIGYNTTQAYAKWCGGLYERLYNGFFNYWERRGAELDDPQWPLVALIFKDERAYASYAHPELGDAATSIVGYYSLRSNRITTYDLTGVESVRAPSARPRTAVLINRILSQPQAAPTVATIIHEATHQLSYNTGLQLRYADNPLWLSEGIAMFFETPDLSSSKGWRNIGAVSNSRLRQLRSYLARRPDNSLVSLIVRDDRMKNGQTAADAYAEAWGLCHFLLRRQPTAFVNYLAVHTQKTRLVYDKPTQRLATFREHFAADVNKLDAEFLRYITRLR